MKDSIERAVKDLGVIRIENLTNTAISKYDLYPDDYDPDTGLFLCQESERHFADQKGGTKYAKKKSNRGNTRNAGN